MSRALLALGCREYDDQDNYYCLPGADTDAERIFGALVDKTGHYDGPLSRLILSPTLADVRLALNDLFYLRDVDVLSFFFAGHGEVHRGIYYLCPKDTAGERLPTTALPIGHLLATLADVRARQINVVLDSCESGGAMLDLANVLKPENLIGPGSPNVSFFAASATDQASYGDESGGYATTALMEYLKGTTQLRIDRPFLDLVELGRRVSGDIGDDVQRPVAWGLNLYGEDQFARNPFYEEPASGRQPLPVRLAPTSAAGTKVREYSEALWHHYQSLPSDPDYGALTELLRAVCEEIEEEGTSSAAFLRGVASSMRDRAEISDDLFAPSDVLSCCMVALLPLLDKEDIAALARELLAEKRLLDTDLRERLRERLIANHSALLNPEHLLADFFLLPIRVSKVLGWLSAEVVVNELLGTLDTQCVQDITELITLVASSYHESLIAMSDAQAPNVYLFARACVTLNEENLAREVLSAYFESLVGIEGFVARNDAEPSEAFSYLVARMAGQPGMNHKVVANPVQFLSALLLSGSCLGLSEWDRRLIKLDGKFMDVFVPDDHKDYGMATIPSGTNYRPQLGHGVWTSQGLRDWLMRTVEPAVSADESLQLTEAKPLCVLASYLFSDRLPFFLEL